MPLTKQQHLDPSHAPNRILSLDGGGIRGVLTLEYLEVIEETLKKRYANDNLLLCDYFDLIGGTSTGSIIAAGLACGMPVAQIKKLYYDLGRQVFQTDTFAKLKLKGILAPKFPRTATQSIERRPWREHDPRQRQYSHRPHGHDEAARHGQSVAAAQLSGSALRQAGRRIALDPVVRASTAAPTYFEPQSIAISSTMAPSQRGLCRRRGQPFQ